MDLFWSVINLANLMDVLWFVINLANLMDVLWFVITLTVTWANSYLHTVVGVYINTINTNFLFKFEFLSRFFKFTSLQGKRSC